MFSLTSICQPRKVYSRSNTNTTDWNLTSLNISWKYMKMWVFCCASFIEIDLRASVCMPRNREHPHLSGRKDRHVQMGKKENIGKRTQHLFPFHHYLWSARVQLPDHKSWLDSACFVAYASDWFSSRIIAECSKSGFFAFYSKRWALP